MSLKKEKVKIGVVGSRHFLDYDLFKKVLGKYLEHHKGKEIVLVSGGARGADSMAEFYATENSLEILIFKPEYDKYPKKIAPMMRNSQIVNESDEIFAFHDGFSSGTMDTIEKAKLTDKQVTIYVFGENNEH